jgi:hypothetical protein
MKNVRGTPIALLVMILMFGVFACSDEKSKAISDSKDGNNMDPALKMDPILMGLNSSVALLDLSMRSNSVLNCLLVNGYSDVKKEFDNKSDQYFSKMMLDIAAEREGMCNLYKMAEEETRAVFNEIKGQKKLLDQQFMFSLFVSKDEDSDGAFTEEEIGLFSSVESCEKIEAAARNYNIPTRKCHEWMDVSNR